MTSGKARVRQNVEKIDGVIRTWFEWSLENSELAKILVVEVKFDTDPNDPGFRQPALDAIENAIVEASQDETTPDVAHLRIVPKGA